MQTSTTNSLCQFSRTKLSGYRSRALPVCRRGWGNFYYKWVWVVYTKVVQYVCTYSKLGIVMLKCIYVFTFLQWNYLNVFKLRGLRADIFKNKNSGNHGRQNTNRDMTMRDIFKTLLPFYSYIPLNRYIFSHRVHQASGSSLQGTRRNKGNN